METGANKTINIELVENKKELSEVVVTALGISKQKKTTWFFYYRSKRRCVSQNK
jgi:hypothetical protein